LRVLRYSGVEGRRLAIRDDILVINTPMKSYMRTMNTRNLIDGLRVQRLLPDRLAEHVVYERSDNRGGKPIPKPVLYELTQPELGRGSKRKAPPSGPAMAVAGDRILLAGDDGTLRVFGLTDGEEGPVLELPAPAVRDGIAVFDGRVYLSLINGQVLCVTTGRPAR
jgi:outer membrane protein assembly factor BamB